jgi:uncharacterized protein YjeT (DUF2065 family)
MSKERIIRTTILIAGIYFIVEFLLRSVISKEFDKKYFDAITQVFTSALIVIGLFSVGLGLVNVVMLHGHRIVRMRPNWEHSVVMFVAFFTMMTFGILKVSAPKPPGGQPYTGAAALFDYVVVRIMVHMNSTIYSFLAFFVTSAALRAFRVRGAESAVMMVAAVIVLLSMAPETSFPFLAQFREWMDLKLNAAVFRALTFGMILGGITVSMRMWLGIERGSMFEAT